MSKQTPFENWDEQQDLPLPDQEQSWQHMKQMLDDDDRKRRILPPVFLNCAGWAVALLLVVGAAWLIVRPEKWWQKNEVSSRQEPTPNEGTKDEVPSKNKISEPVKENAQNVEDIPATENENSTPETTNSTLQYKTNIQDDQKTTQGRTQVIRTNRNPSVTISQPR